MEYDITYGEVVDGSEVVSLERAKENSNIQDSDNDGLLQTLLDAAVDEAEDYTQVTFLDRPVTLALSEWPETWALPVFPVRAISSISYKDENGADQVVSAADIHLFKQDDTNYIKMLWNSAPSLDDSLPFPITVTLSAGYENAAMPPRVQHAVLMKFSFKERFREDMPTSYERTFQNALRGLKRW